VLVVSHQLDVIHRLCKRALWLDRGRVVTSGPAAEVIAAYLSGAGVVAAPGAWVDLTGAMRNGTGAARFTRMSVTGERGGPVYSGGPTHVELIVHSKEATTADAVAVTLFDQSGFKLVNADTMCLGREVALVAGDNVVSFDIRAVYLNPGRYRLGLWLARDPHGVFDEIESAAEVEVFSDPKQAIHPRPRHDGVVRCEFAVAARPAATGEAE
jgi:Wzt C-terminal domain